MAPGARLAHRKYGIACRSSSAYDATRHLLDTGRRRIAAIGAEHSEAPTAAALRTSGFLRAMHSAGIEPDPALVIGTVPWTRKAGAESITRLHESGSRFDAVVGMNDALALGALSALQSLGLSLPGDVAVVGFDDVDEAKYSTPALTTIDSGRDWVAARAVALLVQRMSDAEGAARDPVREVADHRLVRRASA